MDPKVVILGGGPSSLFAWFGALQMGYTQDEVEIWCKDQSYPPGAFWLHETPITFVPSYIRIIMEGSPVVYSRNQWGDDFPSSWNLDCYHEERLAYNPHALIPRLWSEVNFSKDETIWTPSKVLELSKEVKAVVQTFSLDPAVLDQAKKCRFPTYTSDIKHEGNTCVYNGTSLIPWVRTTIAFGRYSVEYPMWYADKVDEIKVTHDLFSETDGKVVMLPDLHPTTKPIAQRVYGPKNNILLTGRFTTLNRKALSHHSQREVRDFLRELT